MWCPAHTEVLYAVTELCETRCMLCMLVRGSASWQTLQLQFPG